MSVIEGMLVAFTIVLLVSNSVVLAFTFLPSNVTGTDYYDFGFTSGQKNQLEQSFKGVVTDANGILSDANQSVSGSTTAITTQNLLDQIISGFGKGIQTITGGIGTTFSIIGAIVKYFLFMLFGYVLWIDYFMAPLSNIGYISGFFITLGWGLKALFFIIQVTGFASIVLPIFTGSKR